MFKVLAFCRYHSRAKSSVCHAARLVPHKTIQISWAKISYTVWPKNWVANARGALILYGRKRILVNFIIDFNGWLRGHQFLTTIICSSYHSSTVRSIDYHNCTATWSVMLVEEQVIDILIFLRRREKRIFFNLLPVQYSAVFSTGGVLLALYRSTTEQKKLCNKVIKQLSRGFSMLRRTGPLLSKYDFVCSVWPEMVRAVILWKTSSFLAMRGDKLVSLELELSHPSKVVI